MEALGEWLKEKFGSSLPFWGLVTCGVVCALVIVLAFGLHAEKAEFFSLLWTLGALSELAKALLTAIIAGAALKIIAVQGFFEAALTGIVFGERGIDLMRDDQRLELWKKLTCRIHAPLLHKRYEEEPIKTLYNNLIEAESHFVDYKQTFYIESIARELTFSWKDASKKVIEVYDILSAKLVPFDKESDVIWKSIRDMDGGLDLGEHSCTDLDLKLPGEVSRDKHVDEKGRSETISYVLRGLPAYEIERTRVQSWSILKDPVFAISSPYVIASGSFRIENKLQDSDSELADADVLFQELGGTGAGANRVALFRSLSGEDRITPGGVARKAISRVLLPNQGFQAIVLLRQHTK